MSVGGVTMRAHRVSWEIHFGQIPKGLCVLHRCDNPPCCKPEHLFLGSVVDNVADRCKKGRTANGERHGSSRLSESDVREIRGMYSRGKSIGFKLIARKFGVTPMTVKRAVAGITWKEVA